MAIRFVLKAIEFRAVGNQPRHTYLDELDALELFGGIGIHQTHYLDNRFKSLTVWETRKSCESELRRNVPNAKIKMVNSYEELVVCEERFDLISMDSPAFYEGFKAFPMVYHVMKPKCFLIVNLWLDPSAYVDRVHAGIIPDPVILAVWHRNRAQFFGKKEPTEEEMMEKYRMLARENGRKVSWEHKEIRAADLSYYCQELIS